MLSAIQGALPGWCTRALDRKHFSSYLNARVSLAGCCNGVPSRYRTKTARSQETFVLKALAVRTLVRLSQSQECSNWRCCTGEEEPGPSCRSLHSSICCAGQATRPQEPAAATGRTGQSSRAYGQKNGTLDLILLHGHLPISVKKPP